MAKFFPRYIDTPAGLRICVNDHKTMSAFMGAEYDENAELVVPGAEKPALTEDQAALENHLLSGGKVVVNGIEFEAADPVDSSAESADALQFQAQPVQAFSEVLDAVEEPKKRRGRPPRSSFPAVGEVRDAEE